MFVGCDGASVGEAEGALTLGAIDGAVMGLLVGLHEGAVVGTAVTGAWLGMRDGAVSTHVHPPHCPPNATGTSVVPQ